MKLFLSLVVFILVVPGLSAADSKCTTQYRVGLSVEAPFFLAENGKTSGLAYDLLKSLESHTGCTLNQEPLSIQNASKEISQWRLDFYGFTTEVPQWSQYMNFDKIYEVSRLTIVNKKFIGKNKTVADVLKDHSIKVTTAAPTILQANELKALKAANRFVETSSIEHAFRLLKENKVQAVMATPVLARHHLKLINMENNVQVFHDPNAFVTVGFYSSKKRISSAERERFQKALKDMLNDGTFKRVTEKYVTPDDINLSYKF